MFIKENYSLLPHNTFGIDAKCKRFVEYSSEAELQEFLRSHDAEEPLLHIGEGSNLVFTKDFDGTILHSAIKGKQAFAGPDMVMLIVGAGENWDDLVAWCVKQGYHGLENLSLIPGEVGAAAVQNIGAYGVEIADFVANVEAINLETGVHEFFSDSACKYGYRESVFKKEGKGAYAITRVHLRLNRTFTPQCTYGTIEQELAKRGISTPTASELRQVIIDIRKNKLPDPKEIGSAGSFFMNPVISHEEFERLKATYPDIPNYPQAEGVKVPAGWLIEQCGWKGKSLGRAGVYEKQALVLVNRGGATGIEVATLANTIVADVRQKFGITITPEANII